MPTMTRGRHARGLGDPQHDDQQQWCGDCVNAGRMSTATIPRASSAPAADALNLTAPPTLSPRSMSAFGSASYAASTYQESSGPLSDLRPIASATCRQLKHKYHESRRSRRDAGLAKGEPSIEHEKHTHRDEQPRRKPA